MQWVHDDGTARLSRGVLNVCPAVGWIDIRQAGRRARATGETQHTGGRSTRHQNTTAQNAHVIKLEPTRFQNQEALQRPAGWTQAGLPVGLQICGPHLGDELVLRAAAAYEAAALRVDRWPPLATSGVRHNRPPSA